MLQEIREVFNPANFTVIWQQISTAGIGTIFLTLLVPVIIAAILLYSNRNNLQPWYLILIACLSGILTVSGSYVLNIFAAQTMGWSMPDVPSQIYLNFDAMFGVSLVEEALKIIVIALLIRGNKKCHAPYDGVIYGALVGLSFAVIENLMPGYANNFLRNLTSVPMHLSVGIIAGYFLSIASINKDEKKKRVQEYAIFFVPALIHGVYNGLLINTNYLIIIFPATQILILMTVFTLIVFIYFIIFRILTKTYQLNQIYLNNGEYPPKYNLYTFDELFGEDLQAIIGESTEVEDENNKFV